MFNFIKTIMPSCLRYPIVSDREIRLVTMICKKPKNHVD